ncbi:hypothetical protein AAK967_07830 [Atopobiaceae bacterium 24-176]
MVQTTSIPVDQAGLVLAAPIRLECCSGPGGDPSFAVADLGPSLTVVERRGGPGSAPWRRGITADKGKRLAEALRCAQGEEVAALGEGLRHGGTFECVLGLLEAAGVACSVWGDPFWA